MNKIEATREPLSSTQREELKKLFDSAGFLLLKGMVSSRCAEAQIRVMNALVYPKNEEAVVAQAVYTEESIILNALLDRLDDYANNDVTKDDLWYTVKLEPRR